MTATETTARTIDERGGASRRRAHREARGRSIDDHLGPRQGRFFGDGFKRIGHRVTEVEMRRRDGHEYVSAKAGLAYPGDWSRKAAGPLRPHLSSVDALALAVQLAESFLIHRYGLDPEQRRAMWLRSFDMRSGTTPQEDLTRFDVRALRVSCAPAVVVRHGHVSKFVCLVGTLTLTCEIEHDVTRRPMVDGAYPNLTAILGPAERRYYGGGYRLRSQLIEDVRVHPAAVEGDVSLADPPEALDLGLGGAYQPTPSMIDALVSLAQLAQVMAYRLDGIARSESNTLWMRRLAQTAARPAAPSSGPFAGRVEPRRSRRVRLAGALWRTLDVDAELAGIQVRSSIAHQLPSETKGA